ncbi:MAG: hypothetical protein DCC75_10800 [Proteobacteria bacterium]|nr:MAG: hypothetical protein DCC75_10800 [Pseudomonadota bacterium]
MAPVSIKKWLGFGVSNTLNNSVVHFFPNSHSISAPYSANCALSIFAGGMERRQVLLEGGRFGNPDGVRLEDAFPSIKADFSGLYAVEVEISTTQSRLDLSSSGCVIEIISQGLISRYLPCQVNYGVEGSILSNTTPAPLAASGQAISVLAAKDSFLSTSLVVINPTPDDYSVKVVMERDNAEASIIQHSEFKSNTIDEIMFRDSTFEDSSLQECSWGLMRARPLQVLVSKGTALSGLPAVEGSSLSIKSRPLMVQPNEPEVRCFAVYRDSQSRRIVSVVSLQGRALPRAAPEQTATGAQQI